MKSPTPQKGHEEAQRIGSQLAKDVLGTYPDMQRIKAAKIMAASQTISVEPAQLEAGDEERARAFVKQIDSGEIVKFLDTVFAFRVLDTVERHGKPYDAEVQVIALGKQLAWVALPGEVFTELGQQIKRASPFPLTIVTELGHGPVTYFPNRPAFAQGNYEVVTSRASPGSGERLAESASSLLQQLFNR